MDEPRESTVNPTAILVIVATSILLGVLNATSLNVVLPLLAEDFDASPAKVGWVISIYLVVYGVAIPLFGRLAERFGGRPLYVAGLALFGAGSVACALAPTYATLLVARVFHAAGGAAFPGLGVALVSRSAPPERRGASLGYIATAVGLGAALGPILGGAIGASLGWRPLLLTGATSLLIIPFARRHLPGGDRSDEVIDLRGGLALTLFITALLLFTGELGVHGLTPTAAGLAAAIVVAAIWFLRRQRIASPPYIPTEVLTYRPFQRAVTISFCATGTYIATQVTTPLSVTHGLDIAPSKLAVMFLPSALTTAVAGPLAGRIVDRVGARIPTSIGALTLFAGIATLWQTPAGGLIQAGFGLTVVAVGSAMIGTPITTTIGGIIRPRYAPTALSLNAMIFFVGGAILTTVTTGLATSAGFERSWLALLPPVALAFILSRGMPDKPTHPS